MRTIIYFIILCGLLHSCKVVDTLYIDYLQPAEVSFPNSVKSVLIVDNTYVEDDSLSRSVITEMFHVANDVKSNAIKGDSKITTQELAQQMANNGYFEEIILCDSALRENDHFLREAVLTPLEVDELINHFNVEMIFSLEQINLYLTKKGVRTNNAAYNPAIDAKISAILNIYLSGRKKPLATINARDTIYWMLNRSTRAEQIIKEASEYAATLPLKYIVPTWKTVERTYYANGGIEMRDAAVCVKQDDWENAYTLWIKASNKKKETIKVRAFYNIALYCELQDKLEESKEWLEKAFEIVDKNQKKDKNERLINPSEDYLMVMLYSKKVDERLRERAKIQLQMNRLENNF